MRVYEQTIFLLVLRQWRKSVLLVYGALARPSGRAPRCMIEPSLTVGLVPRIANRLVATNNCPTTHAPWLASGIQRLNLNWGRRVGKPSPQPSPKGEGDLTPVQGRL